MTAATLATAPFLDFGVHQLHGVWVTHAETGIGGKSQGQ
jgi:hypothetical protein